MPWLPEFGQVIVEARRGAGLDPARGDGTLASTWPGGVVLDDALAGHLEGPNAIGAFIDESRLWLHDRGARATAVATTISGARTIGEYNLDLTSADGPVVLPLAIVAEPDAGNASLSLRTYVSLWALDGSRRSRAPLLQPDATLNASDIVGEYLEGLATGDPSKCVACYEPDGCLQGPGGPAYARCGTAVLAAEYAAHLARGGIILEHCTMTEDRVRTAVEFNFLRWGDVDLPAQARIAIYERGTTGRIARARVYDDVGRPLTINSR